MRLRGRRLLLRCRRLLRPSLLLSSGGRRRRLLRRARWLGLARGLLLLALRPGARISGLLAGFRRGASGGGLQARLWNRNLLLGANGPGNRQPHGEGNQEQTAWFQFLTHGDSRHAPSLPQDSGHPFRRAVSPASGAAIQRSAMSRTRPILNMRDPPFRKISLSPAVILSRFVRMPRKGCGLSRSRKPPTRRRPL